MAVPQLLDDPHNYVIMYITTPSSHNMLDTQLNPG